MPIKREELLEKLETVAPALNDTDLIPILTCVLFTGTQLTAFNDRIAISTPLKTDFKGTAPGKTLIDSLRIVSHAQQVEISSDGGQVKITAGNKTKMQFDSRPVEDYTAIFKMPTRPKDMAKVNEKLFTAIDDCLQASTDHSTTPDHLGITFIPNKTEVKLFGTNATTISYSKVTLPIQSGLKKRVILPAKFCREMLRLGKQSDNEGSFVVRDDHALFATEKATLFSRLVNSENPLNFEKTLSQHLPKGTVPVELTEAQRPRLKSALELAARVCDIKGNEVRTHVKADKGAIEFNSTSDRGKALDSINIKHPPVDVFLQASFLRDVCDRYENILITKESVLLSRDNLNSIFLLATYNRAS